MPILKIVRALSTIRFCSPIQQRPIIDLFYTIPIELQQMRRLQFEDVLKYGSWARDIARFKVIAHRLRINSLLNERQREERFDFRGKCKANTIRIVIKGFNTHAISAQKNTAVWLIPKGKGEHPL